MKLYDEKSPKAENVAVTNAWSTIHTSFDCCGFDGPEDWPTFGKEAKGPECRNATPAKQGCKASFEGYVWTVAGVAVGVLFVEMFSMVLACWLIRTMDDFGGY